MRLAKLKIHNTWREPGNNGAQIIPSDNLSLCCGIKEKQLRQRIGESQIEIWCPGVESEKNILETLILYNLQLFYFIFFLERPTTYTQKKQPR